MLRRLPDQRGRKVRFRFEGEPVEALEGDSVAAALLAAGNGPLRTTPKSGAGRAPYCMMGVCFECLVEINGIPNRQACLTEVRDGMMVRRQRGAPGLPGEAGDDPD